MNLKNLIYPVLISLVFIVTSNIVLAEEGPERSGGPPLANSGNDQNATSGQVVTLNGTASYSPSGSPIVKYFWHQDTSPAIELKNNGTATPSLYANVSSPTYYNFTLTVVDNDGFISAIPDPVYVHVMPGPKCITHKISELC